MSGQDEAISYFFSCGPELPPPSINVTCLLESLTERLLVRDSSSKDHNFHTATLYHTLSLMFLSVLAIRDDVSHLCMVWGRPGANGYLEAVLSVSPSLIAAQIPT